MTWGVLSWNADKTSWITLCISFLRRTFYRLVLYFELHYPRPTSPHLEFLFTEISEFKNSTRQISLICNMCASAMLLRLQFVRAHMHAQSRTYTARLDYIYNLHTWRAYIDRVPRMYAWTRARARARVHVCICARVAGVFWYIDRAWSAISPSHPVPPRSSPHLALPRILPRPCTPTPPSGYPSPSPRVSPSRRYPCRKPSWQPPVQTRIFTCADNNVRGVSHMDIYFSSASRQVYSPLVFVTAIEFFPRSLGATS